MSIYVYIYIYIYIYIQNLQSLTLYLCYSNCGLYIFYHQNWALIIYKYSKTHTSIYIKFVWCHQHLSLIQLCVYVILQCYKKLKILLKNSLYSCKKPLIIANKRSKNAWGNFGKFINQLQPKTKTLVRKLERILIKL